MQCPTTTLMRRTNVRRWWSNILLAFLEITLDTYSHHSPSLPDKYIHTHKMYAKAHIVLSTGPFPNCSVMVSLRFVLDFLRHS